MRIILIVIGVLAMLIGGVWFLQGIGVLLGSFMSGQTRWMLYGAATFIVGLGMVVRMLRRAERGGSRG